MAVLLHQRARQAELGDAVLQHAADLGALLKHRDGAAQLGHLNGDGNAGGTGADHGDLLAARRRGLPLLTVQIRSRDVVLDAREVHRRALAALDARALALARMVAHHGADRAHGVVLEQQLARLFQTTLLEQVDDLRNRRQHWTALKLAERLLAAQAAMCLLNDVDSHAIPLYCHSGYRLWNDPII